MPRSRTVSYLAAIALVAHAALALSPQASEEAALKFGRIANEELQPGEVLSLSEDEVNSYLKYDYAPAMPAGVENLDVRFESDTAVVSATMDMQAILTDGPGRLLGAMLSGKRAVQARCRYTSAAGIGRAEIESFQVDDREMKGPMLTWLVNQMVAPNLDGFDLRQPIEIGFGIDQIRLEDGRAVVIAKAAQSSAD